MPFTRRQKAKARKSRELDMMSDIDDLDIMLGSSGENPIERESWQMRLDSPLPKETTRQMSTEGTIIVSHNKMNPLGKMKLDNLLRLLQTSSILDCLKK